MGRISREDYELSQGSYVDREKQEIKVIASKVWDETTLERYISYKDLKKILNRYAYYNTKEFDSKFSEGCIINLKAIADVDNSLKSKIDVICNDLLPLLNFEALEHIRYQIIVQELLNYPVVKKIDINAIKKVVILLKQTKIKEYYSKFLELLTPEKPLNEISLKCLKENYLNKDICAYEGSGNFKYFIDKLFRLYKQLADLNKDKAETKFIELINSALRSHNNVLLGMYKEERLGKFLSIKLESIIFAKNGYFNFYPITQGLRLEIANRRDKAVIKTYHQEIMLSDTITLLINQTFYGKDLNEYKKLSGNIIKVLIKEKILEKRSENGLLCQICHRRPATGFRNQKICKDCANNIKIISEATGFEFDSIKKALIKNKKDTISRYKSNSNLNDCYTILDWLEYLDEDM